MVFVTIVKPSPKANAIITPKIAPPIAQRTHKPIICTKYLSFPNKPFIGNKGPVGLGKKSVIFSRVF